MSAEELDSPSLLEFCGAYVGCAFVIALCWLLAVGLVVAAIVTVRWAV